jgi:predicted GNAT family acetyltransferase
MYKLISRSVMDMKSASWHQLLHFYVCYQADSYSQVVPDRHKVQLLRKEDQLHLSAVWQQDICI